MSNYYQGRYYSKPEAERPLPFHEIIHQMLMNKKADCINYNSACCHCNKALPKWSTCYFYGKNKLCESCNDEAIEWVKITVF